jgi:hypothetical protein
VSDAATAREQILNRDIDGALVIDPRGTTDTLLVATGGGTVLAGHAGDASPPGWRGPSSARSGRSTWPGLAQDFDGLSSFYLVVGWCVGGYLCASILAISTGARPANPRRAVIRLAAMALVAIVGGLGGAVVQETRLDTARIRAARRVIDPVFLDTPLYRCEALEPELGCTVSIKLETANPVRSFKARGTEVVASLLADQGREPWCAPARATSARPSPGPVAAGGST